MAEYEFVMDFMLSPDDDDVDAILERLGEAGCTDNAVGLGRPGVIAMDFCREAGSADEAIVSAIKDVRAVIPTAELIVLSYKQGKTTDDLR